MQAAPKAVPGALLAINANATLDSSELLGGVTRRVLPARGEQGTRRSRSRRRRSTPAKPESPTDRASTTSKSGVGGTASHADVAIEGSILLEPQAAGVGPGGNSATVICSNSDVPSQTQAATGTEGTIECASGVNGNTHTEPAALFASPITSYQLEPLLERRRQRARGRDLAAVRADAVEHGPRGQPARASTATATASPPRTGARSSCRATPRRARRHRAPRGRAARRAKPVAGVISGLTISPSAFFAAPSGATISAAKRKYGATVSYRDSQAATTTFTVLRVSSGRRQGKSCRRPSRSNQHGKRCTLLDRPRELHAQRHRSRRRRSCTSAAG